MDHTFIQQIREGDSKIDSVLCVVQGVCTVERDAEIKRVMSVTGDLHVEGKVYYITCVIIYWRTKERLQNKLFIFLWNFLKSIILWNLITYSFCML